jgi:hypothetical protein
LSQAGTAAWREQDRQALQAVGVGSFQKEILKKAAAQERAFRIPEKIFHTNIHGLVVAQKACS